MVNQEILNGLKLALSKGEPLGTAMNSFYNAGYLREEIEEAARIAQQEIAGKNIMQEIQPVKTERKSIFPSLFQKSEEVSQPQKTEQKQIPASRQTISDYNEKPVGNPRKTFMLIALVSALTILLGVLIFIIVFRDQITSLLERFF
jgi:hypothetical protein